MVGRSPRISKSVTVSQRPGSEQMGARRQLCRPLPCIRRSHSTAGCVQLFAVSKLLFAFLSEREVVAGIHSNPCTHSEPDTEFSVLLVSLTLGQLERGLVCGSCKVRVQKIS